MRLYIGLLFTFLCCSGFKGCAKNATQKDTSMAVQTLPSGLAYEIITPSTNETVAKKGQIVVVHYTGWLNENGAPGKQFDSSYKRGQPFSFPLGAGYVIRGWDEGVAGMRVGEKRRLYIPASLGYGAQEIPGVIPAHSALVFDVELIAVQ